MSEALPNAAALWPMAGGKRTETSGATLVQSSADAMNGNPLQRKVVITNPMGFHLRPIAAFAKLASTFECTITVSKGDRRVNGKSPLELMLLAAERGSELLIEANGPRGAEALDALVDLLGRTSWEEEPDPPLPSKG